MYITVKTYLNINEEIFLTWTRRMKMVIVNLNKWTGRGGKTALNTSTLDEFTQNLFQNADSMLNVLN